ncbi:MAG: hypothetical protein JW775_11865 [Candidatus Aminicenantes bacterium]|nr:hypothetical protein [Candidatus Aminicenantes bacterium]
MALPFVILALIFLPLPFVVTSLVFGALLAVRPRGEPCPAAVVLSRVAGPNLLRGPPR